MIIKSNLKYAIELWDDLGFYIWMMNWRKANIQCEKIGTFKKEHPIYNFVAMLFH